MKSDNRTKIVSEWEENFVFDVDDADFIVPTSQQQSQPTISNRLLTGTVSQPNLQMCSLLFKGRQSLRVCFNFYFLAFDKYLH